MNWNFRWYKLCSNSSYLYLYFRQNIYEVFLSNELYELLFVHISSIRLLKYSQWNSWDLWQSTLLLVCKFIDKKKNTSLEMWILDDFRYWILFDFMCILFVIVYIFSSLSQWNHFSGDTPKPSNRNYNYWGWLYLIWANWQYLQFNKYLNKSCVLYIAIDSIFFIRKNFNFSIHLIFCWFMLIHQISQLLLRFIHLAADVYLKRHTEL